MICTLIHQTLNSLGHSCIYLIGGETRETVPTALYLRSGDIIVMTGPCRKAFHGNIFSNVIE